MKKFLKYSLFILLALFLFRSWLFEKTVTYYPLSEHSATPASDPALRDYLAAQKPAEGIKATIQQALDLTAAQLQFRQVGTENDPNRSFHGQRAHCVGYAAFFATACNFLLEKNDLADQWQALQVRGKIAWLGIDLHQFPDSPFFRDHDFNVVENRLTGERYFVDASVRDVLGIRYSKKLP